MTRRLGHVALLTLVLGAAWPAFGSAQQPDARAAGAARWRPQIEAVCRVEGCDPRLLEALVASESGGDPRAISPAGAVGLTQLMPATARLMGVNPHDPLDNLRGGARYLAIELRACGGSVECALAGYNGGPGARRGHRPAETVGFVATVQRRYQTNRAVSPAVPPLPPLPPLPAAELPGRGSRLSVVAQPH